MKDHLYHACVSGVTTYQAKNGLGLVRNIEGPDELNSSSGICCFLLE